MANSFPDTRSTVTDTLNFLDGQGGAADPAAVAALTGVVGTLGNGTTVTYSFNGTAWVAEIPTGNVQGPVTVSVVATNADGSAINGQPAEFTVTGGEPVSVNSSFS